MIGRRRIGATEVITIDRPERRNALDDEHNRALTEAIRQAGADTAVRVIVLTGTGSSFCSGADLRDVLPQYQAAVESGASPEWQFGGITGASRSPVPIIAAVNGHAIAGGMELALASDLRICTPEASFAMAETRWAIIPGAGGTQRLPRLIGEGAALDMLMTARAIDGNEALRLGLVSRVVAAEELVDEALRIAELVAANGPLAVAAVRRLVAAGADASLPEALAAERTAFLETMRSQDAREGATAFSERRTPTYRGE
jgi:enoyl-CoA hydratase/carnithine racemase